MEERLASQRLMANNLLPLGQPSKSVAADQVSKPHVLQY
jgi:hypothetical protein